MKSMIIRTPVAPAKEMIMANHKRKRSKHQRSGCLSCKPHKDDRRKNSDDNQTWQEKKARISEREQRQELVRDRGIEP